jgi:hypothetical protein
MPWLLQDYGTIGKIILKQNIIITQPEMYLDELFNN